MTNIRFALLAIALIMTAAPAHAVSSPLGVAGDFNTFVFGDFRGSSDTEGRLAVGGNAYLSGYSVGDKLPANSGDVLVVGGDLNFGTGRIYNGNVRVGGSATVHPNQIPASQIQTGAALPFDFAAERTRLTNLSSSLSGLAPSGGVANNWGGLTLSGSGDGVQVFNLTGAELLNSWGVNLDNIAQGTTVLINVSGENAGLTNMNMEALASHRNNVLFNFYEATTLTMQGVAVQGSVLAPLADVVNPGGVIWGTLIAQSFDGPMQQNHIPFEGNVPTPIPASIALMGTGLVGLLAMRRKR